MMHNDYSVPYDAWVGERERKAARLPGEMLEAESEMVGGAVAGWSVIGVAVLAGVGVGYWLVRRR